MNNISLIILMVLYLLFGCATNEPRELDSNERHCASLAKQYGWTDTRKASCVRYMQRTYKPVP